MVALAVATVAVAMVVVEMAAARVVVEMVVGMAVAKVGLVEVAGSDLDHTVGGRSISTQSYHQIESSASWQ